MRSWPGATDGGSNRTSGWRLDPTSNRPSAAETGDRVPRSASACSDATCAARRHSFCGRRPGRGDRSRRTRPLSDTALFNALRWRSIGPYRGGRVTAVPGVASQPHVYYLGATGGGVWKTDDSGITWARSSDGFVKTGSVGAIAVAPSDPDVIYAGMGEACIRSNFSDGDGVYKSVDAGSTWKHVGLSDSRQIGRIAVHPQNPDIASSPRWDIRSDRIRNAACSAPAMAARPGRTCCLSTTRPAPSTSPSTLSTRGTSMRRSGRSIGGRGSCTAADNGSGLVQVGRRRQHVDRAEERPSDGHEGPDRACRLAHGHDRVWAIVEAKDGGVFRSDDAAPPGSG